MNEPEVGDILYAGNVGPWEKSMFIVTEKSGRDVYGYCFLPLTKTAHDLAGTRWHLGGGCPKVPERDITDEVLVQLAKWRLLNPT